MLEMVVLLMGGGLLSKCCILWITINYTRRKDNGR